MPFEPPKVVIKKGAPAWMVSFSDLNTLLLTFFILLLVFAREKRHGLEDRGLGEVQRSFAANGLRGIFSGRPLPEVRTGFRVYHPTPAETGRIVDRRKGDEIPLPGTEVSRELAPGARTVPLPGYFPRGGEELPRQLRDGLLRLAHETGAGALLVVQARAGTDEPDPLGLAGRRALAAARWLAGRGVTPDRLRLEAKVVRSEPGDSGGTFPRSMSMAVVWPR